MNGSDPEGSKDKHPVPVYVDTRPRPYLNEAKSRPYTIVNVWKGVRLLLLSKNQLLTLQPTVLHVHVQEDLHMQTWCAFLEMHQILPNGRNSSAGIFMTPTHRKVRNEISMVCMTHLTKVSKGSLIPRLLPVFDQKLGGAWVGGYSKGIKGHKIL